MSEQLQSRQEEGAVSVEAAFSLLLFLFALMFLFELCRFIYISLAFQFIVTDVAREASFIGVGVGTGSAANCCVERVQALRNLVQNRANGFRVAVDPNTEVRICDPESGIPADPTSRDCNLCDGPGFGRNRFIEIRIERDVQIVIWPVPFRTARSALARAETGFRDCSI